MSIRFGNNLFVSALSNASTDSTSEPGFFHAAVGRTTTRSEVQDLVSIASRGSRTAGRPWSSLHIDIH